MAERTKITWDDIELIGYGYKWIDLKKLDIPTVQNTLDKEIEGPKDSKLNCDYFHRENIHG